MSPPAPTLPLVSGTYHFLPPRYRCLLRHCQLRTNLLSKGAAMAPRQRNNDKTREDKGEGMEAKKREPDRERIPFTDWLGRLDMLLGLFAARRADTFAGVDWERLYEEGLTPGQVADAVTAEL